MIVVYDPACAEYGGSDRPERPARVLDTAAHLRKRCPDWTWRAPVVPTEKQLLRAHSPDHLERLNIPRDFDPDTPWYEGIGTHAIRSVGSALAVLDEAMAGRNAFALMRPPGHHATASRAMGFCYLNQIVIAALEARERGVHKIAVWDFDAHHGNGTEELLRGREDFLYISIHQYPCYPGTGARSERNCWNYPVPPVSPRALHRDFLHQSWERILKFQPDLVLVSAGFDAYRGDPITHLSLEAEDFADLGAWQRQSGLPVGAVLEGGYSEDLPQLVEAYLVGWQEQGQPGYLGSGI